MVFRPSSVMAQTRRIMRITAVLLLGAALHVSATGRSQKITLSLDKVPVQKVFTEIFRQTGVSIVYQESLFSDIPPVTINVKNATVEEVLDKCLSDQPFTYSYENNLIVIKQKPPPSSPPNPPGEIHGRVTNEHGQPLANANITIKRTHTGTITGANGGFVLKNVNSIDTIIVSFIGYKPQFIRVGDRTNFILSMEVTSDELDKVVIQAYGTTSQRLTTSNIGTVTAAEIERQPILNPLLALQGKVAGLDVTQINGYASSPIKVELRGRSSLGVNRGLSFPSDPLYIIDGVPLQVVEVGGYSSYTGGSTGFLQNQLLNGGTPAGGQSPLFSMNPADIESIEVLKDADATSIYGSKGANGVILITTKKGKAGNTKFDLHISEGVTKATKFVDLLNTSQYLQVRREAFKNDQINFGLIPGATIPDDGNAYDMLLWDTTKYTDWQRTLYGGTGKAIDAQASLSGGDAQTTFRLGVGYNHTENILTVTGADQRASFLLNLNHRSLNQKFSISISNSYSFTESDMISLPGRITYAPDAPSIYDSNGNLNYAGWGGSTNNQASRGVYPFASLKQPYDSKTNFLNTGLTLNYEFARGLSFSVGLGYNIANANQYQLIPIASQDSIYNPLGSSTFANNTNSNFNVEPQLKYETFIGKGKINILVGATSQKTITDGASVAGYGYTSDLLLKSISNAPNSYSSDDYGENRYAALFARITYNWGNRYILNLNARRDGSSNFGPGNQFGNFGSIGIAWIISEEPWLKQRLPDWFSFMKFRGSYGTTGSDQVANYQYLSRYSSNNTYSYAGISSLVPTQHSNPNFQWEINNKLEGALDFGFFHDMVNASIVFYQNRCGNQLVSFPTPEFTGFSSVTANSPALVQNEGWEFTMAAKLIESRNFSWSITFNWSLNYNKLISYPNFDLSPFVGTYVIGQPLNLRYLLHYTGVDPQTGQYTFYDKNHNGVVDLNYSNPGTNDDRYAYNLSPQYFGGLGMAFHYKAFQVNLFFSYKKQIGINDINQGNLPGTLNSNQPQGVFGRWQNPGDISQVAQFTTGVNLPASYGYFTGSSNGGYTDASFIRLSNLAVAYNLPENYSKKMGIQGASVFLHANNLFVITDYKGIDPETQNFGGLPPFKTIVAGLSFNF